jgi:hypothetical protein
MIIRSFTYYASRPLGIISHGLNKTKQTHAWSFIRLPCPRPPYEVLQHRRQTVRCLSIKLSSSCRSVTFTPVAQATTTTPKEIDSIARNKTGTAKSLSHPRPNLTSLTRPLEDQPHELLRRTI